MVTAYSAIVLIADILLFLSKVIYYIFEAIYKFAFPPEERSVAGDIVLITGAGHGIGYQLALKYGSLGAKVVCWDLNEKANEKTAEEIKQRGNTSVYTYKCDVANEDEVTKVAERVKREVGDVTIIVNNAGIMPCHTLMDHTSAQIRKIFEINILAHFWIIRAFLPNMIEKNYGHIVALSSMAGITGIPNLVPYCGSKFAVRGMMEALREEVRCAMLPTVCNIKLTSIYPYMVDTGLCKKPRYRFPNLMPLVPPEEAAAQIVSAQRRGVQELAIPRILFGVNNVVRNFPDKACNLLRDFLDSGVDAD